MSGTRYMAKSQSVKALKGFDNLKVRNDLLVTNPNYFHAIIRADDMHSPMASLGSSLGGFFGTGQTEDTFTVEKSSAGSEYIQYLYYQEDAAIYPSRVTNSSKLPDTLVVGENYEVTLDEGFYEVGAKLHLRNKKNEIYIVGKQNSIGETPYTFQLVGQSDETISKDLLKPGSPVSYSGNIYPEGSKTNHPTLMGGPKRIERAINPMAITRHQFEATGSAESNDQYYLFQSVVDNKITEFGTTNWPVKFMREHLRIINHMLVYSRSNFDPETKRINNKNSSGHYHEVPSYAGIKEQLECAKYQWAYDLKATSYVNALKYLEGILKKLAAANGKTKMDLIAYATGAGRAWLRNVIKIGGLKASGVTLSQDIVGGQNVVFGYTSDKYVSDFGSITVYDIADSNCYDTGAYDKVAFDGMLYDRESLDIFFFPQSTMGSDGKAKPTIKFYYKNGIYQGREVNRLMVFGHQKGMSGFSGNTMAFDQQMSDQAVSQALASDKYEVGSSFDGDLWQVLSQITVMVDTNKVGRLRLEAPSSNLVMI